MIDIAVVGCGMAGLTAAVYTARAGMKTVIYERLMPGGQAATILKLENYPGFPEGVNGADLLMQVMEQATKAGAEISYAPVEELRPGENDAPHTLITGEGKQQARAVIIASGANPRKLGLDREIELTGRGISYCATCDGALFRNKRVAVVGGGDTALTDALVLANYAERIFLIHRREEFRGSPILQKRVADTPNIELMMRQTVKELRGEKQLEELLLHDLVTDMQRPLAVSALFVAVGISPETQFLEGLLDLKANGQIVTDRRLQTSLPRIYAAGDCRDTPLRQVITAAADGALAASSAVEDLL